ncbi:MAG: hypothetical protein WAK96_02770 [Desulfobaccales bacterium]
MPKEIFQQDYEKAFGLENNGDHKKAEDAFKYALDNRKFEIELYWKRATYFWTFIAATFAGYGAIQASSIAQKTDLSVFLSCLGFVFSFGWHLVNRGSKQWQENWENHVDLLEDKIIGPLYKVVLTRPKPSNLKDRIIRMLAGPSPFSVSKINQMISLYVTILWVILIFKSLPRFNLTAAIDWEYLIIILFTIITVILFFTIGRTDIDDFYHIAKKRESSINKSRE